MRAEIVERRTLPGVQSASALERIADWYFIVGDDTPDLLRLDLDWNLVGTTRLFDSAAPAGARIPKLAKPDLEAMCYVEQSKLRELWCFGSGSASPARDLCFRVDLSNPENPRSVRARNLTPLYNLLRANPAIVGAHTLNLEAAAVSGDEILLFQRGNISGLNVASAFPLAAFIEYLDSAETAPPTPHLLTFDLPTLRNRRAGFSAAATVADSIVFAASVEDTDNEIDDGATLGSFIGQIRDAKLLWVTPVEQNGEIAPVKIEGISVLATSDAYTVVCVTDNDEGDSEYLKLTIH